MKPWGKTMSVKIALAGNPNSGKTTLFNLLTGSNQSVGNWAGVTVEKKEGTLKGHPDVIIQDLPGIYSLSPYSPEEMVSRRYLVTEHPDAILNIIDGTNMERSLYLTTQLIELGHPVVVAINMIDLVRKNGDTMDLQLIGKAFGCVCMEISARKAEGCQEAAEMAAALAKRNSHADTPISVFTGRVNDALSYIESLIHAKVEDDYRRWFAMKLFERDEQVLSQMKLDNQTVERLEKCIMDCEWEMDDDSASIIADQRYTFISKVIAKSVQKKPKRDEVSLSDRIDRVVTDRVLALPLFSLVMFGMYAIAMGNFPFSVGTICSAWANEVLFGRWIPNTINEILTALRVSDWLRSLVLDGIVAGVGAVLSFVPQILVLTLLLSILEDIGYMARVAFIMDRMLRRFGLSGKSIIPMLVATGCSVPGILASRTIEQERDRKITVMTTGFIPCGAKMPIIGLVAGAAFGNSFLVAISAFLICISAVVISGLILKKIPSLAGMPASFVMELPAYHLPSASNVLRTTGERGWDFVKRAVTIVLLSSMVLWFLQSYGFVDGAFRAVEDHNGSLLASIGTAVAWFFYPLGWMGDMAWKATVATFTGLVAKEQVVMTLGTLYHYTGELSESGNEIWGQIAADFGPASAYSFMIFNLLCAPCFAAIGAIRKEMRSSRWTMAAIGYMSGFAYAISMIVYQIIGLFTGEAEFGFLTIAAVAVLAELIYLIKRNGAPGKSSSVE